MTRYLRFFISLMLLIQAVYANAQDTKSPCEKISKLVVQFQKKHIQPVELNDNFSSNVFDRLINKIDPDGFIFYTKDLERLSKYKNQIDDQILNNKCEVYDSILVLYKLRIKEVDTLIKDILSKKIDFQKNDFYEYYNDSIIHPVNSSDRRTKIMNWLKLSYLKEAFNDVDSLEKVDIKKLLLDDYKASVEKKANRFYGSDCDNDAYYLDSFLNCIALTYDPHCEYFTEIAFMDFKDILSKEISTFGFFIDEDASGNIIIEEITPGAPAWKSNKIHRGDILLKITWDKNIYDVTQHSLREARHMLKKIDSERIEITIKNNNGVVTEVALLKEKITNEDNAIQSYVLDGDKKIGYISLPDFYTEWDKDNALGCANDVAKEIVKLKNENIQGLILDLRDNGGGSLYEAINLAGIFINEGPLSMVKLIRQERPVILKDMNRGTIYDGPLAIMVNNRSASASELVAAALQDYQRAIIVGTNTYGKATMQATFPLDSLELKKKIKVAEIDYLKVTDGILYRITSESLQKKGLIPDITIPEIFQKLPIYESKNKNALTPIPINKKLIYTTCPSLPIDQLRNNADKRINSDKSFSEIKIYQDTILRLYEHKRIPLTLNDYYKYLQARKIMFDHIKQVVKKDFNDFSIHNTKVDLEWIKIDPNKDEVNKTVIEDLSKDIYLHETYMIIRDLITIIN